MAAAANQPRMRVDGAKPAGWPGTLAKGAAGEPVVALVKPVSTLPAPVFRSFPAHSVRQPQVTQLLDNPTAGLPS
jgi:hypothetical protein